MSYKTHEERLEEKYREPLGGCAESPSDCAHYGGLGPQARQVVGLGGAPTRNTTLPTDPAERKKYPMATGLLYYFPDALAEVARVSWEGNNQHNPGQPLHWDRAKSQDEADTAVRHLSQAGTRDSDGSRHTAKFAWRALALLQKEIEDDRNNTQPVPEAPPGDDQRELYAIRLAAIDVMAMSNTRESYARALISRTNPYWTPAYDSVRQAVLREIELRELVEAVQNQQRSAKVSR